MIIKQFNLDIESDIATLHEVTFDRVVILEYEDGDVLQVNVNSIRKALKFWWENSPDVIPLSKKIVQSHE